MNSSTPITDALGLFTIFAAWIFSPQIAVVMGPYMLIITVSVLGASLSLARRPTTSRLSALRYFVVTVGIAITFTVGISSLVASYHENLTERVLLAPVAMAIGLIGHDWPRLGKAIVAGIFRLIDNFRAVQK